MNALAIEAPIDQANTKVSLRGAYEVSDIDYTAVVTESHSYEITEVITVTIPEPDTLARIDISIPSGNFRIKNVKVEGIDFRTRIEDQGSLVTITDLDELTPGIHKYTLTYTIYEFADRDPSGDLLYLTILPPENRQPTYHATFTISFPDDFPLSDIDIFAGQLGAQNTTGLKSSINEAKNAIEIEGKLLPENFGISLKANLEDGYWKGALDGKWALALMIAICGIITLILFILWMIGGRDPAPRRTSETKPIAEISPIDIGYIFGSRFNKRDLTRLIMYLATKGYLRINEYEHKKYKLYRIQDPVSEEKHIRNAYNILFEDIFIDRAIELEDARPRLARIHRMLEDSVAAGYTNKERMATTTISRVFRYIGLFLIFISVTAINALQYTYQYLSVDHIESFLLGILASTLIYVMCILEEKKFYSFKPKNGITHVLCSITVIGLVLHIDMSIILKTGSFITVILITIFLLLSALLVVLMRARGRENAMLVMRLNSLRDFIYHPRPKDILDNYLENENYYYEMMIYALTFGAEETWAISFLPLNVAEPEWYSDEIEGNAFTNIRKNPTTIDIAKDLRAFVSTLTNSYQVISRRRR